MSSSVVAAPASVASPFFFLDTTSPSEIYTLSLHDALPIWTRWRASSRPRGPPCSSRAAARRDRKSTRLNSSHRCISYAVFCLKKKLHTVDRPDEYAEVGDM